MRFILTFTIIINLVSFGVYAQDYSKIDSLKLIISKTKQDTIKSKVYTEIGYLFQYSIPDSALFYYKKSLKILTITDNKIDIAKCFENIGNIFYDKSDYDKSFEYYQKSLNINNSIDNKPGTANNLGNIGNIFYYQENYSKAIYYYKKALRAQNVNNDIEGIMRSNINIGNIYSNTSVFDSALIYYQKALEYQNEVNNDNIMALTYINIGIVYDNLTNYKKAIEYCDKSLIIYKRNNNKFGMAQNYLELSILYHKQDFYNKAIYNAKRGLELSKMISNLYLQKDIYRILSDIYKGSNQYFRALEYKDSTSILNDSIFNIEKTQAIAEMDARYESEKKKKQIIQQQAELKSIQQKTEKHQNQRNFFIVAVILVFLLVFLANALLRKQKEKLLAAEKELLQKNEQLYTTNKIIESQNKDITEKNHELLTIDEDLHQKNEELLATKELLEEQKNTVIAKNKDLQKIHDDYKQILDMNSDIIIIINKMGKIIYSNNQSESFLGYSVEEVINKHITTFIPLSEVPKQLKRVKEIFFTKQLKAFETAAVHKEGMYVPIEVKGKVVQFRGKTVAIGTIRDITDRKITEQIIKEKTEKYDMLAKVIDDFIWMVDLKLQNVFISPACEKLTGYTDSEAEEIGIVNLHTPKSRNLLNHTVAELLANSNSETKTSIILEYLYKNGSIIKSEVTIHLVCNDKDKPIGFAGISRKIEI